jgi:two-component system nitrogen regulation sensor histidine kinase GlnL
MRSKPGASTIHLRTRVERGLRIRERVHAMALRLEVVDDGRGVPDELAEHLFLPLVSGRAEGSGLGWHWPIRSLASIAAR